MARGVFWIVEDTLLAFLFEGDSVYGVAKTIITDCYGNMSGRRAVTNVLITIRAGEWSIPERGKGILGENQLDKELVIWECFKTRFVNLKKLNAGECV